MEYNLNNPDFWQYFAINVVLSLIAALTKTDM